jgi:hypothetical protein
MTVDVRLWGIDHVLDDPKMFFECLPVFVDGETIIRALSFRWSRERGAVPFVDEEEALEHSEKLELREPLAVPEGHAVLVMGPVVAQQITGLGIELEPDWHTVQDGFRVAVLSYADIRQRRGRYAEHARGILIGELSEVLRKRERLGPSDATPLARTAHAVVMATAYFDRLEIAILDLIFADLLADGGATYSRLLVLHSAGLPMDVELLRKAVEGRMGNLIRSCPRPHPAMALPSAAPPARVEPDTREAPRAGVDVRTPATERRNVSERVPNPFLH